MTKRLRILGITTTYPPGTGGSETYCRELFEGLAALGHEVTVLTQRTSRESPLEAIEEGCTVYRIGDFVDRLSGGEFENAVAWEEAFFGPLTDIEKLLKDRSFDIIHTINQAALILGSFLKEHLNRPLVASYHETTPETDPFGVSRSRCLTRFMPCDLHLAASQRYKAQLLEFGADEKKIDFLFYGLPEKEALDKDKLSKVFSALSIPKDVTLGVAIGRFKDRKRHLELIDGLTDLFECEQRFHLCIAGSCDSASPAYYKKVVNRVKDKGLSSRITVLKDVTNDVIDSLICHADIGFLVSKAEGFGISALEFMTVGVPVIVSNIPGINEIVIHEECGLMLDNIQDELTPAVQRIVADEKEGLRLGQAAKERAALFTRTKMAKKAASVYESLISE